MTRSIRKLMSLFLILTLLLSVLPVQIFAEGETDEGEIYLEGVSVSGMAFESRGIMLNIGQLYELDQDPAQFYMEDDAHTTLHRISIWTFNNLDASGIALSGAAQLAGNMSKTDAVISTRHADSVYHLYRAPIRVGEGGGEVSISYNGTVIGRLEMVPGGYQDTFIGESVLVSEDNNGILTLELSGYNIPDSPVVAVGEVEYDSNDDPVLNPLWESRGNAVKDDFGVYSVKLAPLSSEARDVPWQTISINGNIAHIFSGMDAQIPEMIPINSDGSYEPGEILIPPAVNAPLDVTSPSVSISIVPGDYPRMRYKLDSGEFIAQQDASNISVILTEGDYGLHTVYFEFQTADGKTLETNVSFTYSNGIQAGAPDEAFIKDNNENGRKTLTPVNGSYVLTAGAEYVPSAVYGSEDDETAALEALVYKGSSSSPLEELENDYYTECLDMVRISGTNVYETAEPFTAVEGAYRIGVRVKKGQYDSKAGSITEIAAEAFSSPVIYNVNSPGFSRRSYNWKDGSYAVYRDSKYSASFSGTSGRGYTASMILYWSDASGGTHTSSTVLDYKASFAGWYTGEAAIPEEAAALEKIVYRIELDSDPENFYTEQSFDLSDHLLKCVVTFSGIPDGYEGAVLYVGTDDGFGNMAVQRSARAGSGSVIKFEDFEPGSYMYRFTGESGDIASGKFTVAAGSPTDVPISAVTAANLTINISGASALSAYAYLRYRIYYGSGSGDYISGTINRYGGTASLNHVPVYQADGTTPVRVEVYLESTDPEELTGPGVDEYGILSHTMTEGANTVSVSAQNYVTKTLSGKITTPLGKPMDWQMVYVEMRTESGWPVEGRRPIKEYYAYSFTDENGDYSVSGIWAEKDVTVLIDSEGGSWYGSPSYKKVEFQSPASETVHNVQMEYSDYGSITVDLKLLRAGSAEEAEGDYNLLQAPEIRDQAGSQINWHGGDNGVYYLSDTRVKPGDTLTISFPSGKKGCLEESGLGLYAYSGESSVSGNIVEQTIVLDASSDGKAVFLQKELGTVSASPAPNTAITTEELLAIADMEARADALEAATRYEGYLYIFKGSELIKMLSGKGELKTGGLDEGDYTAVTFYLDTLDENYGEYLKLTQDPYKLLQKSYRTTGQCTYGNVTVNALSDTEVTAKPPAAAGAELMGGLTLGVKTEILPDYPGWAQVKVNIIKRNEKVRISGIYVNNQPAAVASVLDAAYVDGDKLQDYYGSGNYRFYKSIDNTYVEAQEDNEYLMFFTHVGNEVDENGKPVAKADIKIEYDFFNGWSYDSARWWTGADANVTSGANASSEELKITVSMDPFDIDVPAAATFDPLYENRSDFGVVTTYVYGNPGDRIAVYDGDRKVSDRVVTSPKTAVTFRVSDPQYYGLHRIRASRLKDDGSLEYTETKPLVLINRANTIYVNELNWMHTNDTRLEEWHFHELEEMSSVTLRYYPAMPSIVTFRLNNVREGDLDNVRFVKAYRGVTTEIPAVFQSSGVDPETGRSWCEYMVDNGETDSLAWTMSCGSPRWNGSYWVYPPAEKFHTPMGSYADGGNPAGRKYALVALGYFDDFYIDYEIVTKVDESASIDDVAAASLESYNKAAGIEALDLNDITTSNVYDEALADASKEALPAVLRDGYEDGSTQTQSTVTDTTFEYSIENGGTGISSKTDVSDTASYDPEAIQALMDAEIAGPLTTDCVRASDGHPGKKTVSWSKYETLQGVIYIKQVFYDYTDYDANGELAPGGKFDVDMEQEIYAPTAVLNALENGTTVEEEQAKLDAAKAQQKASRARVRSAGSGRRILGINEDVDQGMSRIGIVSNIHGAADIYQDYRLAGLTGEAADKARFMSEGFNRGMAVIGAANTMYDIAKGVQGKNPEALFKALDALDMSDAKSRQARQNLMNEIISYEEGRTRKYLTDSVVNGGTTIAGTADPTMAVKTGLLIGGIAYNKIGDQTSEYIDMEFDMIMRSILLEYQRQEQRDVVKRIELEKELYKKYEKIAEILNWKDGYWDPEEQKTYTKRQRIIREVEKELNQRLNKEAMPRFNVREKFPKMNVYVDPSGYVYEGFPDERVGDITATLYEKTGAASYTQWADTNSVVEDRQANPQTTAALDENDPDAGGRYGWMTPYGTFKVAFTDPAGNYQDAETKDMTVPPEHTTVNIGLLSTEAPEVKLVSVTSWPAITIEFSKYMQMESLVNVSAAENAKIVGNTDSYDSASTAFSFYDPDGNPISGKITFPDSYDTVAAGSAPGAQFGNSRVKNTYYKSGIYQKDEISSEWFAKVVVFTPDDTSAFDAEKTQMMVSKTVQSYCGVGMEEDYIKNVAQAEKETAPKIYTITLDAAGGSGVPASLVTGNDGRLSSLPDPSSTNYTFAGWFTSASGGNAVSTTTVFDSHTTIYAHWSYSAASVPSEDTGSGSIDSITTTAAIELPFTDVSEGTYCYDAVVWAYENGIVYGDSTATFSPEKDCTRAQVVTMLWRAAGEPEPVNSDTPFTDVVAGSYYEKAVAWAYENDIAEGTAPDKFRPEKICTRAQVVTFLWRFVGFMTAGSALNPFKDLTAGSYYYDAVLWAFDNEITYGTSPDRFSPDRNCNRAQIVTFLYRYFVNQ